MAAISVGGINHLTLTVSDVPRSRDFYTQVLNFTVMMELAPERVILTNGQTLLVLTEPWDRSAAPLTNDRFHENRIGLDHVSFGVDSMEALRGAAAELDRLGVQRGEIRDLSGAGLPMAVMAFRDPDNIQLELTAPL